MVGGCAPRLAEDVGMGPDEAVSLTGTVAPRLDRRGSSAGGPFVIDEALGSLPLGN